MIRQIAALLVRVPFEPFAVITTSGHEYRVDHPENAAIIAGRLAVALPNDEGIVTLANLHISEIKDLSQSQQL